MSAAGSLAFLLVSVLVGQLVNSVGDLYKRFHVLVRYILAFAFCQSRTCEFIIRLDSSARTRNKLHTLHITLHITVVVNVVVVVVVVGPTRSPVSCDEITRDYRDPISGPVHFTPGSNQFTVPAHLQSVCVCRCLLTPAQVAAMAMGLKQYT